MIGCIVQARMSSTRLPGKVMMNLDDKNPIIVYVIGQLSHCRFLDKIVVATTILKEDDIIENYITKKKIECFRGSSDDVLDRYYHCAKKFSFSTIVRITSDNPLVDPEIIDNMILKFKSSDYEYITNEQPITYPLGFAVEIFSFSALEKAWYNAKLPSEREHVTPYFYKNKHLFKQFNVENSQNFSYLRCTVDTINDLQLIQKIVKKIKKRPIFLYDVLNLFVNEPELFNINKHIKQDGYLRSLKKDEEFISSIKQLDEKY